VTAVRLDLEYDGGEFSGWAAQPGLRTIEGEVSTALETILNAPVELTVAGRTDAGVHAWGQVASFDTDLELPAGIVRSLNGILPDDVGVLMAARAPDGFNARHDARSRTYCYRVLNRPTPSPFERGRALWVPYPLDLDLLHRSAELLTGTHDFTAFTPTETEHVRFEREVFRAEWTRPSPTAPGRGAEEEAGGDLLEFWVEADAFMRNMVRVLVGTMLEVASGRRDVENFASLLEGAPRQAAGDTSRPHGLYLASVSY
jgi:tRNA pseudouridine38-40 synthase